MVRGLNSCVDGKLELAENYSGTGQDFSMLFNGTEISSIAAEKVSSVFTITQNGTPSPDLSDRLLTLNRKLSRLQNRCRYFRQPCHAGTEFAALGSSADQF
jgi:hypothetical protein